MRPTALVLLALLALGLVGYAVTALIEAGQPRPRAAELAPSQRAPAPPEGPEPAASRLARALVTPSEPEPRLDEALPEGPGSLPDPPSLPVDRADATAAFERLLGQLAAYEGPRSLSRERSAELYRQVNDAFTALSLHETDAEALEDAFARMQSELGRLDLRRPPKRPSQE